MTSALPCSPNAGLPGHRRAGVILALGSVAAFAVFLDTTIVNVAFETISRSLGTTTGHLSWVLNAYSLVFAAVLIPAGRLADRYGRKRLFLIGLAGFALFSALCGAAPGTGVLIAARALQGAFGAAPAPLVVAVSRPATRLAARIGYRPVLGVSIFVVLLGAATGAGEITAYHRIWLTLAALSLASAAVLFAPRLRRRR
jgi:MFS family permease